MNKFVFVLYSFALFFGIVFFGAVHVYAYVFISVCVLLGLFFIFIKNIHKNDQDGRWYIRVSLSSIYAPFFILLAFLAIQTVPLPYPVLKQLSPGAAVVAQKAQVAQEVVSRQSLAEPRASLAVYTHPVKLSVMRWVVYGLFFFGMIQLLDSRRRISVMVSLLLVVACAEALYAMLETFSGSYHVLWYKMLYGKDRLKGTYFNGNHFAGLMAMVLLLAAAFASALAPTSRLRSAAPFMPRRLRSRIVWILSGEQRLSKTIVVMLAAVVTGVGLIFSASRGGISSWAGSLFFMGLLFVWRRGHRNKGVLLLALFLFIAAYTIHIGVEYPVKRFTEIEKTYESRHRYTQKTIDLFEAFPFAGVGVGNFSYAFPKYQAKEDQKKFYRFAHNDWAQYLAEAGVVGCLLLIIGFGWFFYRAGVLWVSRKDHYAVSLGAAMFAVAAYMVLHSFSDFNLHIPANVLVFCTILAISYAALHLKRYGRRRGVTYTHHDVALFSVRGLLVAGGVCGLMVWSGATGVKHFVAEAYCNTVPNPTLKRDQQPPIEDIEKAIEWDSGNAAYWYKLALGWIRVLEEKTKTGEVSLKEREGIQLEIVRALEGAVKRNPRVAQYHLRLGWAYASLWSRPDYHKKWLPAADISMQRAAYFSGVKTPREHVEMGKYWTMRSKTIYPGDLQHDAAWARACWHYREAQSLEQGRGLEKLKKEIMDYVWNFYPDKAFVEEAAGS